MIKLTRLRLPIYYNNIDNQKGKKKKNVCEKELWLFYF